MRIALKHNDDARHGFTLIEIALVLAIMVVVGALAAPMFQGTLRTERLRKSAELIAADWTRTRAKSMETGETQVWICQLADGSSSTSSYTGGMSPTDATSAVTSSTGLTSTNTSSGSFGQSPLPDGVTISEVLISEGDTLLTMSQTSNSGEGSTATVIFYPDGTSSSARLVVTNDQQQTMSVVMNGLAGTVRVIRGGPAP